MHFKISCLLCVWLLMFPIVDEARGQSSFSAKHAELKRKHAQAMRRHEALMNKNLPKMNSPIPISQEMQRLIQKSRSKTPDSFRADSSIGVSSFSAPSAGSPTAADRETVKSAMSPQQAFPQWVAAASTIRDSRPLQFMLTREAWDQLVQEQNKFDSPKEREYREINKSYGNADFNDMWWNQPPMERALKKYRDMVKGFKGIESSNTRGLEADLVVRMNPTGRSGSAKSLYDVAQVKMIWQGNSWRLYSFKREGTMVSIQTR